MSKSHNKKRNVGLLYEFLVATISRALVEGDQRLSSRALRVLKKHFKPGTELYKEFRLVNSLSRTTVTTEGVAVSILREAKQAARSHDVKELDRQKSLLIRDINHLIRDENFYDQHIQEYRSLATIQTLINAWRSGDDIGVIAEYEDRLARHLLAEKTPRVDTPLSEITPGENRLLMKVMMKKLNEKYAGVLNEMQRSLVRAYAFSTANDDTVTIKLKLAEVKNALLESMDAFVAKNPDNEYVNSKMSAARQQLLNEQMESVDDEMVARFMLYAKLNSELCMEDDNA